MMANAGKNGQINIEKLAEQAAARSRLDEQLKNVDLSMPRHFAAQGAAQRRIQLVQAATIQARIVQSCELARETGSQAYMEADAALRVCLVQISKIDQEFPEAKAIAYEIMESVKFSPTGSDDPIEAVPTPPE